MASLAENNVYLKMGGTEVDAYFKSVALSVSNSGIDITAGSGVDWVQRAPGLNDASITIDLAYDGANVQTYIQKLAAGQVIEIEYGPEDNVSGKPRHVQEFTIDSVDAPQNVDKSAVVFSISGSGAAAPTVNMYAGGVYS